jgi:rubredoxin
MQRWRCSVCGYIHIGNEPPEKCPVCGADRTQFVLLAEPLPSVSQHPGSASAQVDRWKCSVCSYLHAGSAPPDSCPVCGSLAEKFEPQVPTPPEPSDVFTSPATEAEPTAPSRDAPPSPGPGAAADWRIRYDQIAERLVQLHAHPIAVHIPNGVLPVAVALLVLSLLFHSVALEQAAFYNMIAVALAMPVVLYTGINDWQRRFRGALTSVFITKMVCGAIVCLGSLILVAWRALQPGVVQPSGPGKTLYVLLHLVLFTAGAVAGFFGGKLIVFPDRRS